MLSGRGLRRSEDEGGEKQLDAAELHLVRPVTSPRALRKASMALLCAAAAELHPLDCCPAASEGLFRSVGPTKRLGPAAGCSAGRLDHECMVVSSVAEA